MTAFMIRVLLVAAAAGVIAAPALGVASAVGAERTGSASTLTVEQSSSASPTATPAATPTPTRTEPEHTPTVTRTPEPTRSASGTPSAKPSYPATTKPEPTSEQVWEALVRACLEGRTTELEPCLYVLSRSGTPLAELRAKIDARLDEIARLQASRGDLEELLRRCIESQATDSDACMKAWRLSGLTLEDFKAMILQRIGSAQKTTAPQDSEAYLWLKKCLLSHELLGPECYRAWQLSGLSSEEFDKKIMAIWAGQKK